MRLTLAATFVTVVACLPLAGRAETVVLQPGVSPAGDYAGCTTTTLWPKGLAAPETGDKFLYFRGENTRMLVRFDLPNGLKAKPLAWARLWVFLPEVRKDAKGNLLENRYVEIVCSGMTAPWDKSATWEQATVGKKWEHAGGDFDNKTDYQNGRFLGATDSYELYAHDHAYWTNHMHWLPVSVPASGMWVAFNVTPLAEKWLADPAANTGVMLSTTHADRRMPNPWEIDIPSAAYDKDAKLRPKLELEFSPAEPVQVGMTPSLRKVNPWSSRYMYRGEYKRQYDMQMAGNEWEGFQLVVNPLLKDLANIRFSWDDLADAKTGAKLTKDNIAWFCEDVLHMTSNWIVRDVCMGDKCYWVPDPLVPADLSPAHWRSVRRQQATPFWFTVHAPLGTKPGDYATTITMTANGVEPVKLKLAVHVWDYEIPVKWNFSTVGSFGGPAGFYKQDWKPEWLDKWYDFLLDHRLAPVEQYAQTLSPPVERLKHCVERGMNILYLHGNFKPNSDLNVLKERHKLLKDMGLIDLAVVYVEDEGAQHEMRKQLALKRRQVSPEAMMLVGGAAPNPFGIGYVDVWDPEIDGWPGQIWVDAEGKEIQLERGKQPPAGAKKVDRPVAEARKTIEECQARGEKFFWYVAAAPTPPYPNVQLEYPLIAARQFIWMSWKYRATGFEYYCYNIWGSNVRNGQRWPEAPWNSNAFKQYNCDGMLFYPGPNGQPCASIRLENIRDGIEDWESFYILRDYADAFRARKSSDAKAAELLKQADALLDVPDEVVASVTKWTQDDDLFLKTRRQLGNLIVSMKSAVTAAEYEKVRDSRQADQLARQKKMLKERAEHLTTTSAPAGG